MRHRQAPLGHHLHQVAQTELEAKVPAHAQDDDFAVEVATLEQLRYRLQLAHRRPQPVQRDSVADPTAPFAPEPAAQCGTNNHAHRARNPGNVGSTLGGLQSKCWTPMIWRYGTRSIG